MPLPEEGSQPVNGQERQILFAGRQRARPRADAHGSALEGRTSPLLPELLEKGPGPPRVGLEHKGGRLAVAQREDLSGVLNEGARPWTSAFRHPFAGQDPRGQSGSGGGSGGEFQEMPAIHSQGRPEF